MVRKRWMAPAAPTGTAWAQWPHATGLACSPPPIRRPRPGPHGQRRPAGDAARCRRRAARGGRRLARDVGTAVRAGARHAPARPADRPRLRGHARPLPAARRDRLARRRPAALAGALHLSAGGALCRPRARSRGGPLLLRRAGAPRRDDGAHLLHLAPGVGRCAVHRSADTRPAPDRRQVPAGSPQPRWRARRDRAEPDRYRSADQEVARRGPPGLRHHAAPCTRTASTSTTTTAR